MLKYQANLTCIEALNGLSEPSQDLEFKTAFGLITFQPAQVMSFLTGIFGFPEAQEFILAPFPYGQNVHLKNFFLLQSPQDKAIAFILFPFLKSAVPYAQHEQEGLAMENQFCLEKSEFFAITTFKRKDTIIEASLNLKAPIVIDFSQLKGTQYLFEKSSYPLQQTLATFAVQAINTPKGT